MDNKSNYEEAHGVVYFDPNRREFIQVREKYFSPNKEYKGYLKTGHFISILGDAKNNVPFECIKQGDLARMVNIEEVGLKNIKNIYFNKANGEWTATKKPRCPHCNRPY